MRRVPQRAWLFVFAVAGLDVAFAWVNRDILLEWEGNPFAAWMFVRYGLAPLICLRIGSVLFAWIASRNVRVERVVLPVAVAISVYMLYAIVMSEIQLWGTLRP